MDEVLVAEDVRKTYGDTVALDGVSLTASAGEVLALVGPNGAGKTTFVRTIAGTTEPDAGTVRLLGDDPAAVDRTAIGVLPQAFSPPDRLSAAELLRYYAGLYDDPRDPTAVLESVGAADTAETRYEALSGGQQRRVCLGTTLVNDPEVLLLDEPTTGIDPQGRRTVRELIDDLAETGSTVLVTTHDMDEAERLADRVALLADGRLRAVGSPADLVAEYGGAPRLVVEPTAGQTAAVVRAIEDAGFDVVDRSGDNQSGGNRSEGDRTDEDRSRVGRLDADRTVTGRGSAESDAAVVVRSVTPEDITAVVEALAGADVTYEELEWRRPTLEDAYVELAGNGRAGNGRAPRRAGEIA